MHFAKPLSACALVCFFTSAVTAYGAEKDAGPAPYAYEVTEFLGLPITNSMIMSWIISLAIILAFRFMAGGKPKMVPDKGQQVVEGMLQFVKDLIEPIVGKRMVGPTLPLLLGFFTYILIHNWSGMLPGVGAIGHMEGDRFVYWFRPANADVNMTLALGIIGATVGWLYFSLRYAGPRLLLYDIFGNKADPKETPKPLYVMLIPIFFAVGLIEVVSILFRNVSLTFRLFGNVYGGENLLVGMTNLVSYVIPVPFYFLEVLIGFVQAMVFTLLVAVYIGLICNHGDEEHAH